MEKRTLPGVLEGKILQIPDYQRGYSWDEKQWKDFAEDLDALVDDRIECHYTGTIVLHIPNLNSTESYGTKVLDLAEVVDGQQRLTTCSLYLSILLNELIKRGRDDLKADIPALLYQGSQTKLKMNSESNDTYLDLISKGKSNIPPSSLHQERLINAYAYFQTYIENQIVRRKSEAEAYLIQLLDALTRKLKFSVYLIEDESEVGMTFELMNSRGKDLTSLELLKNYLLHWSYRNILPSHEKDHLLRVVNKAWKEVYTNISACRGSESQCLRIAWTLYIDAVPANWEGYRGFKSDQIIPLRNFSYKSPAETHQFILDFVEGLALVSKHYAAIFQPSASLYDVHEFELLTKIKYAGNLANYLPLMVAARIKRDKGLEYKADYIELLKALSAFSYRVFLWEGRRSNTGLSKFYRWADNCFTQTHSLSEIVQWIYQSIEWYSPESTFRQSVKEVFHEWYYYKRLLLYTLYEWELHLLEGKNKPKLHLEDLSDSTIEHILPQNPAEGSDWLRLWSDADREKYLHDIGNLVLTRDNSRYSNFEFQRKKGESGLGYCYSNSDIRQERAVAQFAEWTPEACIQRREEITDWIIATWGMDEISYTTGIPQNFEDESDTQGEGL